MTLLEQFNEVFGVWEEARPYVQEMVTEQEMRLIVAMQGQAMRVEEIAHLLDISQQEAGTFLLACYARHIVNRVEEDGVERYAPSDLYARLDHFVKYENWHDIPEEGRRRLDRSYLQMFIDRHRENVEKKKAGLVGRHSLPNDTIMLLHEIEAMIEAAEDIVVQPCDCRMLGESCNKPIETCMWFDAGARASLDRGFGRRLTKEEAVELVRWADKKGLMHTADSEWQSRGLHAVCNCCADDCYPFRAAQQLESKGVWPKSRFLAAYAPDLCSQCGACVKRCQFGAFYHDDQMVMVDGRERKLVHFDPDKCWGCGLCANTCPNEAIIMVPLEAESFE